MGKKSQRSGIASAVAVACVLATLLVGCNKDNGVEIGTEKPMTKGPIVYVALGDSTGAGVGAREGGYVARLFQRMVERRPDSKLNNLCVSGSTTADVVRGQLERAVALDPDLVTVGIGINDIGHGFTLDQFSNSYEEILRMWAQQMWPTVAKVIGEEE